MGSRPDREEVEGKTAIERGLIGRCLVEPSYIASLMYEPPDLFASQKHRDVVQILMEMWKNQADIDFLTVADAVKKLGMGVDIAELSDMANTSTSLNFDGDLQLLKGQYIRRKVVHALTKANISIHDDGEDPQVVASMAIEDLSKIVAPDRQSLRRFWEVAELLLAQGEAGVVVETIPTGFADLDLTLGGGLRRGILTVIAARPSLGKSALATQIGVNIAKSGKKVLVFPIEMSADSIVSRIIASESRIEPVALRKGRVDWLRTREATAKLKDSQLWFDDDPALTSQKAIAVSRELSARLQGLDLIVVDYLQRFSDIPNENRNQWLGSITKAFSALGRQIQCPVILISQLNRRVETASEKRPGLGDLRESGEIEQDADVVMMLYREHYYNQNADPHLAEVIVAKQRDGPTGTVKLYWSPESVRFENLEVRYSD